MHEVMGALEDVTNNKITKNDQIFDKLLKKLEKINKIKQYKNKSKQQILPTISSASSSDHNNGTSESCSDLISITNNKAPSEIFDGQSIGSETHFNLVEFGDSSLGTHDSEEIITIKK